NELRDSPYLRVDVFLLEDLIPQARWTRPGLRADDTQIDKTIAPQAPARPQRRGGRTVRARTEPHVPAVVPTASPESEKEQRRLAVLLLDQLSRADQPGGLARGRSARRLLLETLFNIAEERGAIATEQVERDARQITMCWLAEGHPLVVYARQPAASLVHLFNFVGSTRAKGERVDWVNAALFAELLSRVEGDNLESNIKRAIERGVMRAEDHGSKAGYVIDYEHQEVRIVLGEFDKLNGTVRAIAAAASEPAQAETAATRTEPPTGAPAPAATPSA